MADMAETVTAPSECDLRELGFTAAADQLSAERELARKLRIAFEFYSVVSPTHVAQFNDKIKKATYVDNGPYSRLVFNPIESYRTIPPKEVLEKVREAKDRGCFDSFEVATIQSVKVVPDPIIFGRIKGCANHYYIAQWDNDVRIEDILKPEEIVNG